MAGIVAILAVWGPVAGAETASTPAAAAPPPVIFQAEGGAPAEAAGARCRAALAARGAAIAAAVLEPEAASSIAPIVCHVVGTAELRARLARRLPDWGIGIALPSGRTIALDWQRSSTGRRGIEEVFLHELAHALMDQGLRGAVVPAWFQEGVALRQSGEWKLVDTVGLVLDGAPPRLEQLEGSFPVSADWADQAYRTSLLAVEALEKRYGADIVPRLVAASARTGNFDYGFEDVTGAPPAQFAAEFDEGLTHRLGWLVALTRWPILFVALALVLLIGGVARLIRSRRRLADMDDDVPPGGFQ